MQMRSLRLKSVSELPASAQARVRGAAAADVAAGAAPGIPGEATGSSAVAAAGGNDAAALSKMSDLEETLALHIRAVGIPEPMREYKFDPKRRWRADFAWPELMLLVEVEGGHWTGGRHTRGSGFDKDCEKYNEAALFGWKLIRVTGTHIKTGEALAWIVRAMA